MLWSGIYSKYARIKNGLKRELSTLKVIEEDVHPVDPLLHQPCNSRFEQQILLFLICVCFICLGTRPL